MKNFLKVCMILLTCCMANVFVYGTTNDISIVCAKDYGIENPKYRKGDTIWDTIYFGYYYQSQYDDKKEPIRWKVLSVNGDNAFIMAEECLDCQPYNKVYEDVTWETCSLRKWLNEDFYNEAFTSLEQEAIISTNVINNDTVSYCPSGKYKGTGIGGNDTYDKIYLLSIDEANNIQYGFGGKEIETRVVWRTDYAEKQGVLSRWTGVYAWLRSPADNNKAASYINTSGSIINITTTIECTPETSTSTAKKWTLNNNVNSIGMGIQPVLHIDLSKTKVWSNGGKITSEGGWGNDVKGTKVVVPKNYVTEIDDLYYRVTKTGKKKGEVELVGWYELNTFYAIQLLEIPKTVKIKGYTYKVTGIANNALKGCKDIKTLIIGSNMKKIGQNAFLNCKKLKSIEIKSSQLKSVGKNALKGINKNATIKVPKKQYKKYKKLFKSKTGYKKTMKIKK